MLGIHVYEIYLRRNATWWHFLVLLLSLCLSLVKMGGEWHSVDPLSRLQRKYCTALA